LVKNSKIQSFVYSVVLHHHHHHDHYHDPKQKVEEMEMEWGWKIGQKKAMMATNEMINLMMVGRRSKDLLLQSTQRNLSVH
jgi:hypothetical protein